MAYWLLKTEPGDYSYDDLVRDTKCVWDGVENALALKHLRTIAKGDRAFIYHTGDDKAVIGIADVTKSAYVASDDLKLAVVDLKPVRKLKHPVTLKAIKADAAFAAFDLVRNSRLSAMPVPADLWAKIEKLSETPHD